MTEPVPARADRHAVLHLDTERTWRGGENQIRMLLTHPASASWQWHLAAPPDSEVARRLHGDARVVPVRMRGARFPLAAQRIARYVRARRIPLIACQSSRAHSLALLVRAFVPDVAIVVHRRVDYPPNASWWSRRKYLSRHVARYICVSDAVRRVLRDFGIPEDRLVTVHDAVNPGAHTGLDRRAIRERLAAAWSIPPETTIVGNIAYLTVQKGHDTLLRALAALRIMGRRVFCYIAGAGPLEAELRRLAAELGLGDADVRFLGVRGDVPELLAATDVFALSSNDEGLGTSLLDAAHAGCALVATRVGGIPEVVVDERTGLLAPPRDPAAFARQLARVVDDRALRLALGAAAREHAATDFSWGAMVDGTLAVYAAVIERAEDEKTRGREDERPGRAAGRTRNR